MKKFILLALLALFGLAATPAAAQARATVTLIHFSDYHSHAVPFYAEGKADTAGIARLIAFLKTYSDDPSTLILSGGDTMNLGTPAWSDKYTCAEWPWFNGIVDAMAYGNHDADYGPDIFAQCRSQISYPILSSNVLDAAGQPLFQADGKTYKVFEIAGQKIGVFAAAGPDFDRLVKPNLRPAAGATFADRIATVRQVVADLREKERVNAVVLIGHALREDDIALAQAVPGIDIILGTHSHRKEELFQIPNTSTYMISPFQYASYVSKLSLQFEGGKLTGVSGGLVALGPNRPQDPGVATMVAQMQGALEADPQYAPLFQPLGEAAVELSTEGQFTGEAVLGNFVMDIFRDTAKAQLALATASGFREPIPPGRILEEGFRTAMPYKNKVLVYSLTGAQVQQLLDFSVSRSGSDFFSQVAGVRFAIVGGKASDIQILKDAASPAAGYAALDPAATYSVATSDFQGKIAGGYKDIFAQAAAPQDLGIDDIRNVVRDYIRQHSPVSAQLDGRMSQGTLAPLPAPPAQDDARCFPETGQCISGRIRSFWEQNGGLAVFGLPLGPQQEVMGDAGKAVQAQWFERHRLELHPENAAPYDVLLGRLGVDRLTQQGRDWQGFPAFDLNQADAERCRFFRETQHQVCDAFLQAFRSDGLSFPNTPGVTFEESLALFGLPISEAISETIDGKEYTVQWFERARLELHPENQPPYNLLFGRLGAELQGGTSSGGQALAGTSWQLVSFGAVEKPQPATTTGKVKPV